MTEKYRPSWENFFVRLDEPCHPSSRLSEIIECKGLFVIDEDLSQAAGHSECSISFLVETESVRGHKLRNKTQVVATKASGSTSNSLVSVDSSEVVEKSEHEYLSQWGEGGRAFEVRAKLNVSSLIPRDKEAASKIWVSMMVECQGRVGISNVNECQLYPRSDWEKPFGGILYPGAEIVRSNFLVFEGWALHKHHEVQEVDIVLNDKLISSAEIGIWNPDIRLAFPDTTNSKRGVFNKVIYWDDVKQHILSSGNKEGHSLKARVRFANADILELEAPKLFWKPDPETLSKSLKDGFIDGEIDSIRYDSSGLIELTGWIFSQGPKEPKFSLKTIRKEIKLSNDPSTGTSVSFFQRKDITEQYVSVARHWPYGFKIKFNPFLVGRSPGQVSLLAETNQGISFIGNKQQFSKIGKIISELSAVSDPSSRAKAFIADIASEVLPSKLRGVEQKLSKPGKRVVFATHNLSDVEGAPLVLAEVVAGMCEEIGGENILVYSAKEGNLRQRFEALGIKVVVDERLSVVAQTWQRYHSALHDAQKVIEEFSPSFIYANVIDSFWAIDLAERISCRAVWAIHEVFEPLEWYVQLDPRLRLIFFERLSSNKEFVFVSQACLDPLKRFIQGSKWEIIPNGIDLARIDNKRKQLTRSEARSALSIHEDEVAISIIGVTDRRKGQDIFLKEMAQLKRLLPDKKFRFFIVGRRKSQFADFLEILAKDLGFGFELSFIEETPEVEKFYIASDVIVVASRNESFSLVSVEAFAYQVPLITTSIMGLSGHIRDQDNALVFDVEQEGSLASSVAECLTKAEVRDRITLKGRADVEQLFDISHCVKKHVGVLHRPAGQ